MMKNLLVILLSALAFSVSANAVPILNSYPSASATIYLDFDGQTVTGTYWNNNGLQTLVCAPAAMSDAQITEVFNRVAEDYRPFNLNITTDEAVFLAAPLNRRMRVIITPTSSWTHPVGGIAYVGSFTWGDDTPCFVFSDRLGPNNPKYVGECCSHESGHTLALSHQSSYNTSCQMVETYASGIGTGETGWAPIMGNSYYRNMTGWSFGPTPYGCTVVQDNLTIITTQNGFTYRTDDYPDNLVSTQLTNYVNTINLSGIIATNTDNDVFRFQLTQSASCHLEANPFSVNATNNSGANLDIMLKLYDANKNLIGTFDPQAKLSVVADTTLNAGVYYFLLTGTGNINASDYGSIGAYAFTLTSQTNDLFLTETHIDVPCNGDSTGSVTVSAFGGTAPYTGTGTFTGLPAGSYTYTVTDDNGNSSSINVTISQRPPLVISATPSHVSCHDGNDGTVSVSASGGTAPYSGTEVFTGFSAGTYYFTVTDDNGCQNSTEVEIIQPEPLTLSETHTDLTCYGSDNGTVTISVSGGTGPYSGTGTFTGLAAGIHDFTVTDANGCSGTITVEILQPAALAISANQTNVSCYGADNGTVEITAAGGTGPYDGTGIFTGLAAGNHDYTITDANGCTSVISVLITQPELLSATLYDTACSVYSWNGNTYTQSGLYSYTSLSASGCDSLSILYLTVYPSGTSQTNITACDSYTWPVNGMSYSASGIYTGTTTQCITQVLDLTIYTTVPSSALVIVGADSVCTGQTAGFSVNSPFPGFWISSNRAVAVIDPVSGILTGVASGVTTVSFNMVSPCGDTVTSGKHIRVTQFLAGTISGPNTVCAYMGNSPLNATYSVAAFGSSGFAWTVPSLCSIISGQGTSTITVHYGSTFSNGTISVKISSLCGGNPVTRSMSVDKGAAPAAPAEILGPSNVCDYLGNNVAADYSVELVPRAAYYSWVIPPYSSIVFANQDSSVIRLKFLSSFSTLASSAKVIKVRAVSGCGISGQKSLSLTTTVPAAAVSIFGPANLCMIANGTFNTGKDTVYFVRRIAGASSYIWTLPSGVSILSRPGYPGPNDTLINVRITNFSSGSITVKGVNNCGQGALKSLALSRLVPAQPGTIYKTTITSACPDQRYLFKLSTMPSGASYLVWQVPYGARLDSLGSGGLLAYVTFPARGTAYNDTVRVTAYNSCGQSPQRKLFVSVSACVPFGIVKEKSLPDNSVTGHLSGPSENDLMIEAFPNPVSGVFRLRVSSKRGQVIRVRILDAQGHETERVMMRPGETVVKGEALGRGIYFVEALQGREVKTIKLIRL